jgi:hypothetical protein
MLAAQGQLKPELMQVIKRFGDPACDFVWRNKKSLLVGAALTAFVTQPEAFLNGTQKLTSALADATVKPLAVGVANNTNWTLIGTLVTAILAIAGYLWASSRGIFSGGHPPRFK